EPHLLRLRHTRSAWRTRRSELVEQATARRLRRLSLGGCRLVARRTLGRRRRGWRVEDGARLLAARGEQCQQHAGGEERRREPGRDAGEEVGGATARHEAAASADAERTAFGALQQDDADERRGDHEVKDEQNGG